MHHQLKLLFVHVPKCGGTSINQALAQTYGERLHIDVGDGPADPAAPTNFDPVGYLERAHSSGYPWLAGKDAVTGHFWARKYDQVGFDIRATVLRDPIARALSLHAFWMAMEGRPQLRNNVLRRYLVENKLDVTAFCRVPIVHNFYTGHMFRDCDMRQFHVIADQRTLYSDWGAVAGRMGLNTPEIRANATSAIDPHYGPRTRDVLGNPATMGRLRDIFAADLRFHERWAR